MNAAPEVLVVGAGPTGLTMAAELARHGARCRIIEASPAPATTSRAIVIHARTLELFAAMGIADRVIAAGRKIHALQMVADGRAVFRLSLDPLDTPYPFTLGLSQAETERFLTEHLQQLGVTAERAARLTRFTQDADGVTAAVQRGDGTEESIRAAYLVGCDGAHSTVRQALSLAFEGAPFPETFALADVKLTGNLPEDEIALFLHAEGLLLCVPLPGGRCRIIADLSHAEAAQPPPEPTFAQIQQIFAQRGPGDVTLTDPLWISAFRIHHRKVNEYRVERVFVAGDAAHIHSPAMGQGMNTGIQDAINLGWKLAGVLRGRALPVLLDSYGAEREPVAREVITLTGRVTEIATLRQPIAREIRDRLMPLLGNLEPVRHRILSEVSELSVNYRSSPIVEQHGAFHGGPAAGDRALDAALPGGATLFERLRGTEHVLLLFDGLNSTPGRGEGLAELRPLEQQFPEVLRLLRVCRQTDGEDDTLPDPDGAVHRRYGARQACAYLVRPDGYVGFRGTPPRAEVLRRYLGRLFVTT
jgi:2-polyprenyl-6-methoxyphenol hydroxylase-like FAD-dependent oxidoreductase